MLSSFGINNSLTVTLTIYEPPYQIGTDTNWTFVTADRGHTIAIKTDGSLWAWGGGRYHHWGGGTMYNNTPREIDNSKNMLTWAIWDEYNFIGIKKDGTLWTEDKRYSGFRLGQKGTDTDWASIAVGGEHIVAIKTDGSLWSFSYDLLGDGID